MFVFLDNYDDYCIPVLKILMNNTLNLINLNIIEQLFK